MKQITAIDMFCGAGGESTGISQACAEMGFKLNLSAINHWERAIETHSANHPEAKHFCQDTETLRPSELKVKRVSLMWASPSCTHHSVARGGRPRDEQGRATAWHVLNFLGDLYVERLIVENVPEFLNWGPIGADGKPLKSKAGTTFQMWLNAIRALGYTVDWRVLNAADFGDPTTRKRLFIQAVKGKKRIVWPEPTHSAKPDIFLQNRWRSARECIDWSVKGQSIFTRKTPLCERTLARIAHGLRKFGGKAAEPFLVKLYGTSNSGSINDPVPTVTSGGGHIGVCQPFIIPHKFNNAATEVSTPLNTITTVNDYSLVEPFITRFNEGAERNHALNEPLPVIDCSNRYGVVEPFIIPQHAGQPGDTTRALSIDNPVSTITTAGAHAVVEPFVVAWDQQSGGHSSWSADKPLSTITTKQRHGIVEPFIVSYYGGSAHASNITDPLDTVTTRDRFGLISPDQCDILFRMLTPQELAKAQGFPESYYFAGTKTEVVKQIGNAVPVNLARELCKAVLSA